MKIFRQGLIVRILAVELLESRRNAAADLDVAISNLQATTEEVTAESFCRPATASILERVGPNTVMFDVDGDGNISAKDALLVLEEVDRERAVIDIASGPQITTVVENEQPSLHRFDVNRDGSVTPSDALLVINRVHFFNALVPCTCSGCLANAVVDGV